MKTLRALLKFYHAQTSYRLGLAYDTVPGCRVFKMDETQFWRGRRLIYAFLNTSHEKVFIPTEPHLFARNVQSSKYGKFVYYKDRDSDVFSFDYDWGVK